jgi:hypothetical protein
MTAIPVFILVYLVSAGLNAGYCTMNKPAAWDWDLNDIKLVEWVMICLPVLNTVIAVFVSSYAIALKLGGRT